MRSALLAMVLLSSTAIAAPDPKAEAHYKQGKVFLDSKQYDQAIVEFQAAYALDKLPSHLFNIAKAYEAKGDHDKTIEYYQKFIDVEPKSIHATEVRTAIATATRARDAERAKKLVEEQAAKREAAGRDAVARVKQAEAYEQAGAWKDAGTEHRAAFEIDGDPIHLLAAAAAFRKVDLAGARDAYKAYLEKVPYGGESDQVRVKLAETQKAIDQAAIDEKERLRKEEEARRQAQDPKPTPAIEYDTTAQRARRGIALRIAVPGAIVTVAGVGLGVLALGQKNSAKDDCDAALVCTNKGADNLDGAQKKALIADIMIGAGLAATIAGIVLWVKAPGPVEKVRVTPMVTTSGGGISFGGAF